MRNSRRAANVVALLVCFGLASCASAPAPETGACAMSAAETVWVVRALDAWRVARADELQVADASVAPTIVFYNESCAFTGEGGPPWRGVEHGGSIALPGGGEIPPQVASFASPYADNTRVFFAMALPSIWQSDGVQSAEFGLETLMVAVLIHEMTHTRQFEALTPRIDAIARRYGLGDDLTDDIVQDAFRGDAAYVAAYEAERDLLFRAAAAASDVEARGLARQALGMMRARRAAYFVGDNEKLAPLDDIFLTMEGLAQWNAYAWLVDARGGRFNAATALPGMRRGGSQWSQDEGLALFLVIDRLVPDWRTRAFADEPALALDLLALAAGYALVEGVASATFQRCTV